MLKKRYNSEDIRQLTFILKWNETMKIRKKTCESGLLVHRSFKAAILACNANIKEGERGFRFYFTSKFDVGMLTIKE
jgi:hypothetical protein